MKIPELLLQMFLTKNKLEAVFCKCYPTIFFFFYIFLFREYDFCFVVLFCSTGTITWQCRLYNESIMCAPYKSCSEKIRRMLTQVHEYEHIANII